MSRRIPPDRAVAIGAAILGVGALMLVSIWIYTMQERKPFWDAGSYVGGAITAVGVLTIAAFAFRSVDDDHSANMSQNSGNDSTNLQAGRDLKLGDE
jgi:hypothetical protein